MTPHPLFFLVRPGVTVQTPSGPVQKQPGRMVPLIAVDELPDWIDVVGAPRELTAQQAIGRANLGNFFKAPGAYPVMIAYATGAEAPVDAGAEDSKKLSRADLVGGAVEVGGGGGERRVRSADANITSPNVIDERKPVAELAAPSPEQQHPQPQPSQARNAAEIHPADRMRAHWNV